MNQEELRQRFASLPLIDVRYKWDLHRESLRRHVANEEAANFLRWSTIQATMYVGNGRLAQAGFDELSREGFDRWEKAIMTPPFGDPDYLLKNYGSNYIHQAHQLKQFEDELGIDTTQFESIAEFGGGYGAMCAVARKLGFLGDYHIFDLPELSLLQKYYLSNISIKALYHTNFSPLEVDCIIAIASLSEAPLEIRDGFLGLVKAKYYLIRFQRHFFSIDNEAYFLEWAKKNLSEWKIVETKMITHLALMGVR